MRLFLKKFWIQVIVNYHRARKIKQMERAGRVLAGQDRVDRLELVEIAKVTEGAVGSF